MFGRKAADFPKTHDVTVCLLPVMIDLHQCKQSELGFSPQQEAIMLPIVVLSLCLCAALSAPSLDPQLDQHWELWKDWHSKKYHEVGGVFLV